MDPAPEPSTPVPTTPEPGTAPPAQPPAPPVPNSPPAVRRSWFGLGPARPARAPRPHPYANEPSTPEEMAYRPQRVAAFWLGLATALTMLGLYLGAQFSDHPGVPSAHPAASWTVGTEVCLFGGLALLGFGFVRQAWAKRLTLAGWLLFGFYWALVAQDLFYGEQADYINLLFAVVGVYFFTYLAYQQWLSEVRRVDSHTVHFLNVSTFVAAGAYFVIDKVEPVRRWLILAVSRHTSWMLNLFGQGSKMGLVYRVDPAGTTSDLNNNLAQFAYKGHACAPDFGFYNCQPPAVANGIWAHVLHFDPTGQDPTIVPVSIILACTALQSIMLFVGLFMATPSSWRKRLAASAIVAAVVYVLNLLRNTGIVWFYGQGQASFWVMHDAVGKGGSLIAMIAIAFLAFAWFPEFLTALIGVLDLPYRDGPLERALHIGRRRPEPAPTAPPAPPTSP